MRRLWRWWRGPSDLRSLQRYVRARERFERTFDKNPRRP